MEPPQGPSAYAMGHHSRCFTRKISSLKGAIRKKMQLLRHKIEHAQKDIAVNE